MFRSFKPLLFLLVALAAPLSVSGQPAINGTWEAARTVNDERLYIVLSDQGKAEVVEEYELPMPGKKQRARSSTFGKWVHRGNEIVVTYGNISDRLRRRERTLFRSQREPQNGTSAVIEDRRRAPIFGDPPGHDSMG
jgi:hypothetical protein